MIQQMQQYETVLAAGRTRQNAVAVSYQTVFDNGFSRDAAEFFEFLIHNVREYTI